MSGRMRTLKLHGLNWMQSELYSSPHTKSYNTDSNLSLIILYFPFDIHKYRESWIKYLQSFSTIFEEKACND